MSAEPAHDDCRLTIEHKGNIYIGFFSRVSGAGGILWHLMIYRGAHTYYYGQLSYLQDNTFRFSSNSGLFEDMSEFFGAVLISFYQ